MAHNFMQYTYYLIVLTACIDQGDGRWKRKDKKENLRHDIEVFRKMADKVEQEIEAFYEEYPDERLKRDNVDKMNYKYVQNTLRRNSITHGESEVNGMKLYPNSVLDNSTSDITPKYAAKHIITNEIEPYIHVSFKGIKNVTSDERKSNYNWPKFEDILLEMGKRYDWKNDRWIKVKEKKVETSFKKVKGVKTDIDFHEKHKFSYKIVKLNRNKSRRNVVVAVSAVR